jgi:hypothetical protein
MEALKLTQMPNSYWGRNGIYQKEIDELYAKHVPGQGSAKTLNGELIRSISRLFHEFCNNGNCNACYVKYEEETYICCSCGGSGVAMEYGGEEDEWETEVDCDSCGGSSEEVEGDCTVNEYYGKMLELISKTDKSLEDIVSKVENIITSNLYSSKNQYTEERMNIYNELCDRVIFYVINNEDKELPENYQIG